MRGGVKAEKTWRNNESIYDVYDAKEDMLSLIEHLLPQSKKIEIMLHIAQPENGLWWFEQANAAGVTDYDWIGLSYYPLWSEYDLNSINAPIKTLIETYDKRLMIVETAYPFTLENVDKSIEGKILVNLALKADEKLVKNVEIFDVFEGDSIGVEKNLLQLKLCYKHLTAL